MDRDSDDWGCMAATLTGLTMFTQLSRRSGRTERMLAAVKPGTLIVCENSKEAARIRRILADRNNDKDVKVVTVDPKQVFNSENLLGARASLVLFDHSWVEQYFVHEIRRASSQLNSFRRSIELSGSKRPDMIDQRQRQIFDDWERKL